MSRRSKAAKLAILVPCYNESSILRESSGAIQAKLRELCLSGEITPDSFVYFVDDGSTDDTWQVLTQLYNESTNKNIKALRLAFNAGQQAAILAGLDALRGKVDCVISMDADLQYDINVIPNFLSEYKLGSEIVFGVRRDRRTDTFFKKTTALLFYKFLGLLGVSSIKNHSEFRLLSAKVLSAISQFSESSIFLRNVFASMGFKRSIVYFDVLPRIGGDSKYHWKKMFSLALVGITSSSIMPLRLVTFVGISIFLLSLVMISYIVYIAIFTTKGVPGWASTVLPIYFIGGAQLLATGLIGEYLAKVFFEVKRRPRFLKDEELN